MYKFIFYGYPKRVTFAFFWVFFKVLERYLVKLRSSSFLIFFLNLFVCLCVMSDDYLMVSIFLLSQLHI